MTPTLDIDEEVEMLFYQVPLSVVEEYWEEVKEVT